MTERLLPVFLVAFYGFTLSGTFSVGKLLAAALGGVWLALGPAYRKRGDSPLLAYLAAISVTAIWSLDPWVTVWHLYGTYTAGLVAALVLVPYWTAFDARHRPGLVVGLRAAAALLAVVCLAQRLFGWLLPYPLFAGNRAYGTLGSPIYIGALIPLLLPFCSSWPERLLLLGGLWSTSSRSGVLGCALGALYAYWPMATHKTRLGLCLAGAAAAAGALHSWAAGASDLGRVLVWHSAIRGFLDRPWVGWGAGNFIAIAEVYHNPAWNEVYGIGMQDQAHNIFFEAAATSGLIGIAGLLALLAAFWKSTETDRTGRAALLGLFVVACLEPIPIVVKAIALMIAATASISYEVRSQSRPIAIIACNIIFAAMFLVILDRIMTYYADTPWSLSSIKAGYMAGLLRSDHSPLARLARH